ncbi:acyl transferase 4-like [Iris pallida]|uniref:Acyl transferase 4-like n=1 Tax=Iris pallida TaxID=29817 RepID=A0AAX6GHM3_IRIPA|nr:acyl transferase 4-like [Iris pallida]KAJ6827838.1 acyl transferase 4-like [Iris pallida]
MSFSVTKKAPELVAPAEATPTGTLSLSSLDRLRGINYFVEMIFVFSRGEEPSKVIKEAISKVLVPYYPVAGRLTRDASGKMQVACTGEGMWFVEASADCALEDVDYLKEQPLMISSEQLLPCAPPEIDQSTLWFMVQVTEFTCGGFAMGFKSSHVMFDGIGAGQFKVAIGEMARGLTQPTLTPVWCREDVPSPPELAHAIELTHSITFPPNFEHHTLDISLDRVNQLQSNILEETGQRCSVFDVVTAKLWQCRTRAINQPPQSDVSLSFTVNIRQELRKELPSEGLYYGNCIFQVVIMATSEQIANATLPEIIMLIKEEKKKLSAKFSKFLKGEKEDNPGMLLFTYGTTNLSDARRVGLSEADYGWGTPTYIVPLVENPLSLCLLLNAPVPKKGMRLVTHCVMKEHLEAFKDELKSLA